MNILIVSQYFWPENFRINDLVSSFMDKGHTVTVLTGMPNYPEGELNPEFRKNPDAHYHYRGAKIIRVPHVLRGKSKLRLALNYLTFFTNASILGPWKCRKEKFDVIFVFAVSPVTMAIPAIVLGRLKRAPIFLWVQDLWPETLSAVGIIKSPALLNLVGVMVRWIYDRCEHILIQSRAFFPSIKKHCKTADLPGKVLYFPNWAEPVFGQQSDGARAQIFQRDDNYFTILFAGNMGEAQDFPSILDAVERTKENKRLRWIIVGDGRVFDWVKSEITKRGLSDSIKLMGRHPVEAMPQFFAAADVLLVTLKPDDIFTRTVPAKIQSYFAATKPILCMVDGEARAIIDESGAGKCCASGDSTELAHLAQQMSLLSEQELTLMGENGFKYYQLHFDRDTVMAKLESYFNAAMAGQIPE